MSTKRNLTESVSKFLDRWVSDRDQALLESGALTPSQWIKAQRPGGPSAAAVLTAGSISAGGKRRLRGATLDESVETSPIYAETFGDARSWALIRRVLGGEILAAGTRSRIEGGQPKPGLCLGDGPVVAWMLHEASSKPEHLAAGTALGDLVRLAEHLLIEYPWSLQEVVAFILTGHRPSTQRVRVTKHSASEGVRAYAIRAVADASPTEVAARYDTARHPERRGRPPADLHKYHHLIAFVLATPRLHRNEQRDRWNKWVDRRGWDGGWRYENLGLFTEHLRRAWKIVFRDPSDPEAPLDPPAAPKRGDNDGARRARARYRQLHGCKTERYLL